MQICSRLSCEIVPSNHFTSSGESPSFFLNLVVGAVHFLKMTRSPGKGLLKCAIACSIAKELGKAEWGRAVGFGHHVLMSIGDGSRNASAPSEFISV
jgi:hypothetical protein